MANLLTSALTSASNTISTTLSSASSQVSSAISSATSNVSTALSSVASGLNTASNLAGALSNLSNPAALVSSLRSLNLPIGGGLAAGATTVLFAGDGAVNDWRVRLSVPNNKIFASSPIFAPLRDSNGLVFPYTPTIQLSHQAQYDEVPLTHQNYQFVAYQNSRVQEINISGPFNVEDAEQAKYWIAMVHFFRSVTKMYTGTTDYQGSPPPILSLNGYGDHVFKNVPVIVKSFTVDLPGDVDYITTTIASGTSVSTGDFARADRLGTVPPTASSNQNTTHVPVKSVVSVTLLPVYSRDNVRVFSLQKFVNGDYISGSGGFI